MEFKIQFACNLAAVITEAHAAALCNRVDRFYNVAVHKEGEGVIYKLDCAWNYFEIAYEAKEMHAIHVVGLVGGGSQPLSATCPILGYCVPEEVLGAGTQGRGKQGFWQP